ncbi:MAG: nickel-dependent lactate racemase [Candidatus Bathyarchaeota archaeon]|nr:nickel-dependent lactate racemase [Candidatus Bathyarchaeota archaeon]
MVDVWLPYGKSDVCIRIPARNLLGSIEPKQVPSVADVKTEIERALDNPIGSKRLREIAQPENKIAIVVDDFTRNTPSYEMLPPVLSELNSAGVSDENIKVIFGCGTHRPVKSEEAKRILGEKVLNRVKTISHNCNAEDLVLVGKTQHNNKIYVNRVLAEAEVKVLVGDVGFHYYAGYGGGRKSVLPAVSGQVTIHHNHAMLLQARARTGVLEGNPVHEDMTEAARLTKVDFILNVVTNSKGKIVKAFAGDLEQAFLEATKLVEDMYRVTVDRRADIVVVSPGGYPADINLYQAYKALDNALEAVKRGGTIIIVAECPEGHGNQVFYDWMTRFEDLKKVEREVKRHFELGGHKAYYLLKALKNHKIILVSSLPDYYSNGVFKLKTARAVNDAFREALKIAGSQARVWVMPQGNSTLPEIKSAENA